MNPGCFCARCLGGFREFLRGEVDAAVLARAGVGDVGSFDYRSYLGGRYPGSLPRDRSRVPLWGEFRRFQYRTAVEYVRHLGALSAG